MPSFSNAYTSKPLLDVITEMEREGKSWKYTSVFTNLGDPEFCTETTSGGGDSIKVFTRKNYEKKSVVALMKEHECEKGEIYQKYFSNIFRDTNAQTSIRERVAKAIAGKNLNTLLEVKYVPKSGRDKGNEVSHFYIGATVQRVVWLNEVAVQEGSSILKKEKVGTLWTDIDYNNVGREGGIAFPNGKKPVKLIQKCFELMCDESDIYLDFFAGSGTTAHATMSLNALDEGSRKYICVQLDEPTDEKSEARITGYNTVFEITRERIIRAAKNIQDENPDSKCDFGFKEFKTIPANVGPFKYYLDDADTMEDYVPFDGMALDDDALGALLTTWKVYDGLPLHQDLIAVDLRGYTAYQGDDKLYFIHRGLELSHVAEMLRRLDEDASFAPRKLVAFHYMFGDKMLREFSEAVNAPNRKHLELQFIQRF